MEPRIVLTPEEEKRISEMTNPESMKEEFRSIAAQRGLIYFDAFDKNIVHEVENPPAPARPPPEGRPGSG